MTRQFWEARGHAIEGHDHWRYGEHLGQLMDLTEVAWLIGNVPVSVDLIVDVGCGTGWHAHRLIQYARRILCLDQAQSMLDKVPYHRRIATMRTSGLDNVHEQVAKRKAITIIANGSTQYMALNDLRAFAVIASILPAQYKTIVLKTPIAWRESHQVQRDDGYYSFYRTLTETLLPFHAAGFELVAVQPTWSIDNLSYEQLTEVECDPRRRQMWITMRKHENSI